MDAEDGEADEIIQFETLVQLVSKIKGEPYEKPDGGEAFRAKAAKISE